MHPSYSPIVSGDQMHGKRKAARSQQNDIRPCEQSHSLTHVPVCFSCVSARADGLPEDASHPAHCSSVRSGLSPCKLPSDPRLSMRELIMADGPRCKRRKQANPRRKNGKSCWGKCPGAVRKWMRDAGQSEIRPGEIRFSLRLQMLVNNKRAEV